MNIRDMVPNAPEANCGPNSASSIGLIKAKINLPSIEMTDEARARQQELIRASKAAASGPIADVVIVARDLQTEIKKVRAQGMEIRRPLNAACSEVIRVEDDYCGPLEAELKALKPLVKEHDIEDRKRVEAEEQARAEQIEKMRAENAPPEAIRAVIVAPLPEPDKLAGASTKRVVISKVIDEDALYKAHPDWFTKPELKKSAIKACYFPRKDATETNPDKDTPGIVGYWGLDTNFRSW